MAATATSVSTTAQKSWSSLFQDIKDNLSDSQRWQYLIPTIGAIAIGAIFIPNVGIGLAAGAVKCIVSSLIAIPSNGLERMRELNNSEYGKFVHQYPLVSNMVAPILEELLFRGAMQPLLTQAIVWIVPAAAAAFLGTPLSIATIVSIVATSVIFGLVHLTNSHKNSHIQAIETMIGGMAYGLLAAQFGLGAPIAAHILNNTIFIALSRLLFKQHEPTSSTTSTTHT